MSDANRKRAIGSSPFGANLGFSLDDLQGVITGEGGTPAAGDALAIRDDGSIQFGAFTLTGRGLVQTGKSTETEWEALGGVLARFDGAISWMVGDWMVMGEREYGKTYDDVARAFGYERDTLYTYAWLCRHVNISIRIEMLSSAHHRLIAAMPEPVQRAALEYARRWSLTVADMRKTIKAVGRLPEDQRVQWLEWARDNAAPDALIAAIDESLDPPALPGAVTGDPLQNPLFSKEMPKQARKMSKMAAKAAAGDERARLVVIGWIATMRNQLDALAESMGKGDQR